MPNWLIRPLKSGVLLSLAAVFLSTLPLASYAQNKIGYVDVPRILEQAPQAEAARKRIEGEFAPRDRALLRQQKDLRAKEDKLIRDRDIMTASQRTNLERDIRSSKREVRRSQDEFREDLNLRRNQELGKLRKKVIQTIRSIGKSEKFDLIVVDGVIHASAGVNITAKVLASLNTEQKK